MLSRQCIVICESACRPAHDARLQALLDADYTWVAFLGKDCAQWEEAMDELAVGDGTNCRFIVTTIHPNDSMDEVVNRHEHAAANGPSQIDVIRL